MTRALYHENGLQLDFSAPVVAAQGQEVALEATAFYPESGGQSSDVGTLSWDGGQTQVEHVRKDKATGTIWHRLTGNVPEVGVVVTGEVAAAPRWRHTQRHSAEHLLAQAFKRVNPVFEVASVGMTSPECHIDFVGDPAEVHIRAAEQLLRETLGRDELTLETPIVPEDELANYPLRRESKVGGQVRLVIFRDSAGEYFDVSACGGTHVPRAAMCAPVVVLRSERVRGGQTRVVFMAGEEASEYLAGVYRDARAVAQAFSAPVEQLPERVDALRTDLSAARADAEAVRRELARHLLATAPAQGKPPLKTLTLSDPALLMPVLTQVAAGEVVAAVETGGSCGVASGTAEVKAGDLLRSALAQTGGKGGGKPDLAQGTTAQPAEFLAAVRGVLASTP
ncbi:MAG: alanine--tRNA ligase-related protein [Deinococcus sp.]|uniref:alanine--tRNA ligase-related protein n=1 Tax=Deinococcus sp. TaxID=47478 RepID=UPI0026DC6F1F|nr:alanine--tRNA ligase-related protein [Deinococcus sp.]MDO4244585.1 alanine--tRNA ligase-related protein [Deinococcus sp.]